MLYFKKTKKIFTLMIGLSTLLLYGQEIKVLDYKEKILLEDFESVQITNKSIQVQANKHYLPEVRMSKNLTSPDLQSNTSLFIRISTEGNGIPIDLSFPSPYKLEDYIIEFEFNIYSNQANGELFLYLQDAKFEKHKIRIANLNYEGWQSFRIPIGNRIAQSDFLIGKHGNSKITGIQFNPHQSLTKEKEYLIAIDDIFVTKRKKYKLPAMGLSSFH